MKRMLLFFLILPFLNLVVKAQDDVYFVPTKKALQQEKQTGLQRSSYQQYEFQEGLEYDNWSEHRNDVNRSVDEYNRRSKNSRLTENRGTRKYVANDEQTMTERLVRFRSPRAVLVSSPFYYDYYYDLAYYDPWFSQWGWTSWYVPFNFGLNWGWTHFSTWRYAGWNAPWFFGGNTGWYWEYRPYYYSYYHLPSYWGGYGRRNGVYYDQVTGSNRSYASRGGRISSRDGSVRGTFSESVGRGFSSRSRSAYSSSNKDKEEKSYSGEPSRRGNMVSYTRSGRSGSSYNTNETSTRSQSSQSYSTNRAGSFSSRSGNYSPSSSRGGSFSSQNGFSGSSSRSGGRISGGRR